MIETSEAVAGKRGSAVVTARRDILTGGVTVAAILMFVGTGGSVLSDAVGAIAGVGGGADRTIVVMMLLNVALILFGWRRYSDLAREVKERAAAEELARDLAAKDPLTGFLNRRSLAEEGAAMLARAERRQKSVAMLVLDLDNFKNVNDVHGHAAGDALLRAVAAEIARALPPVALAARLGGDEFACGFLFDPMAPETVSRVAERIVSRLSQPFEAEGVHAHISVSVGIARSETGCDTVDTLMRRADIAMYSSKNAGRNRHSWFDASMEQELKERNALESGMRGGIPRGEFIPYYEQQVELTTGKLLGFEVLARWNSPLGGLIEPETVIPVAEETGMIGDLSLSIIRQALEHGRDWDQSVLLSVNISPAQLKDPWLAQKLVKVLVETGFPASRLEIEITESSLFENLSLAQSIVGSLKNQGIRIALDDFGTGYSSLAHLRALPFDRIKIDRSFVASMHDNPESAAIVSAIAKLGESLGLPVTAEGVETAQIAQGLSLLGIEKGQGWHYGKPLSVNEARKLLAERHLLVKGERWTAAPAPASRAQGLRRTA